MSEITSFDPAITDGKLFNFDPHQIFQGIRIWAWTTTEKSDGALRLSTRTFF